MATTIYFNVPAIPVAQPRQRHRVVHSGDRAFATNYTPKSDPVNAFKATVQLAASQAYSGPPLTGPLQMVATFIFPRPKAMCWKKRPMPRAAHIKKPDCDNLWKSLADSLTGLLFVDDSQICSALIGKSIASGDEQPHCEISITQLANGETNVT